MRIILLIMIFLAWNGISSQDTIPSFSPIPNSFIQYKEQKSYNSYGIVPLPVEIVFQDYKVSEDKSGLTLYDLRAENLVTPIRNQGACGACWMFTTMASIESNWIKQGYGEFNLSEQNIKNCHGFINGGCDGGNHLFSTAYLARGDGPLEEDQDTYNVTIEDCIDTISSKWILGEAIFLPSNQNTIKSMIQEYGGLYTTMYFDYDYYNATTRSYCYSGISEVNHGVMLAGWDDEKVTSAGTGAWIAKNSFGAGFGDHGYFYISYFDTKILSSNACFPEFFKKESNLVLHHYDELGWISSIGYGSEIGYALVKFTAEFDQYLEKVGTYLNTENAWFEAEIYHAKEKDNLHLKLGETGRVEFKYPGYYYTSLKKKIFIKAGESFFVRMKYKSPNYKFPIPLEAAIDNYSDPTIEDGVCWISANGLEWEEMGRSTEYLQQDLCVKVIAHKDTVAGTVGNPIQIKVYPNPFRRFLNIEFLTIPDKDLTLNFYNSTGQLVYEIEIKQNDFSALERIDLKNLRPGMYFLSFDDQLKKESFIRVVKTR